ncbi:sugar phosphate isomerase/epimerase [Anaerotruncus sp. DFI.9.16]|uniref:sugar phosphate isomerase/epimerase family protein n=1 Tax=Anaerotruncus sp. DFI.9.16 TaxID=2965275 RepID=UPI00210CDF6C|nr:sugar phosphate isomerase/epimerase [Anaerotruncus sp. DFI.9.16]MCQ4895808.1 sugar phosphate isomerase/epimerase [Anaerotruncus sp. DFI.9.16]
MLAGISTACFYPELTERGLSYIAGLGAQAAEVFFNAASELDDCYLRELRRTADGGGTRILSVHPFTSGLEPLLFFSDYRRRFADGIAFYQRYFHAANLLGAKLFVFHGDRRNTTRSRRFYFDRFAELCEAGRRMGVTVAQENVPRCAGYCPDFFTDMRAYLPGARFVLDIKQCVRAGYSPAEMADAMGEGLVHLHVSDHGARGDCLPLGAGELDLAALLGRVRGYGFDGGVMLELYRDSYGGYGELDDSYARILAAIHVENG